MATILLSAAGAMIGGGFGGTVLGLSGAVVGRALGATVGRVIDQRLMGGGSRSVETGRIDRFRVTGASEGSPVARLWGRMRVPGQVIWASPFEETRTTRGGKGAPQPKVTEYSYSVSLAIALCEGVVGRLGRIWADGVEVDPAVLNLRLYNGTEDQEPDPLIEAIEGPGCAPAYRGIAYLVIESLELSQYGNRVPQFSFEVVRAAKALADGIGDLVQGVALIPGTGEYALATTPVRFEKDLGEVETPNQHSPAAATDLLASLAELRGDLPNCQSVSLVVSWFGSDLRCGHCRIKPKVERRLQDGSMPWSVNGLTRATAEVVPSIDGRTIYGGTPTDAAVVEAIAALQSARQSVMFYPFILMEQMVGNGLPDPWGGHEQAAMPWRGRVTASVAPGRAGSPVGSASVAAEVAAFFGTARPSDFEVRGTRVTFHGNDGWSYRRMVLHYAHLCAAAGGVGAFCIGSEMVGLTTLRGEGATFPAVDALRALAADCRAILGPECKIGYAADWSEYFGYHPGNGDVYFHLDPLWADPNIDFVGIDNYLPLSDWREGDDHLDAAAGSLHDLDYLKRNVEGGEYYDWFYAGDAQRAAQVRSVIADGAHGEDWVWRVKDIRGWWSHEHRNRVGGERGEATPWCPGLKPVWFTEIGCAALDKGTNQPNRFLDRYSAESGLPYASDGKRDDLIQMQYLRALLGYWREPTNNPVSDVYGGPMIDLGRTHVWAWDARPFPQFPARGDVWADNIAYGRGHWLNGRASAQPLAGVVAEICAAAGVEADVSDLRGVVRGYIGSGGETGRALLQPLMLAHGFDAVERDGKLVFRMRGGRVDARPDPARLAVEDRKPAMSLSRASDGELVGRVRLSYVEAEGHYEARAVEAIMSDERPAGAAQTELAMALNTGEARHLGHRWLAESRVSRDGAALVLPPSLSHLGAGDVIALPTVGGERHYRIDRAVHAGTTTIDAVRVERELYRAGHEADVPGRASVFVPAVPVLPVFMDLPLMAGDEVPHAPHVAATAQPWPGSIAIYSTVEAEGGYAMNTLLGQKATIGRTLTTLSAARPGVMDRGAPLRLRLASGQLSSCTEAALLSGANLMAIGDGSVDRWELFQFQTARLVAPGEWELSGRLRGQSGTEALMPEAWPAGSMVVLMNGAPRQISLAPDAVGLVRHYRIGSARRPWDDPSYVARDLAFAGAGQRPYAPCHLRIHAGGDGSIEVSWIRRTRVRGDNWAVPEVPLGESSEAYRVRLSRDGAMLHEETVTEPSFRLGTGLLAQVGGTARLFIDVAQVSDLYGPGPYARIAIND